MLVPRSLAAICCLGFVFTAHAQQFPVRLPSPADTVKPLQHLNVADSLIRRAMVDSLNRRFQKVPRDIAQKAGHHFDAEKDHLRDPLQQQTLGQTAAIRSGFRQQGEQVLQKGNALVSHNYLNGLNDTVKRQFVQYVRNSYGTQKTEQFVKGWNVLKDTAKLNSFVDEKLRGFYAVLKDGAIPSNLALPRKLENKFTGASAELSYGDTTGNSSGWWNNIQLHDQISLGSIPVNLNYANISGLDQYTTSFDDNHLAQFKFDKTAYLNKIQQHLKKNYDLRKYFLEDIDFKAHLKSFVDDRMKALQAQQDGLSKLINADQLVTMDSAQIRNMVFDKSRLDSLPAADSLLESYYTGLLKLKNDIGSGLQVKSMLQQQHLVKGNLDKWMNDPSSIQQVAGDLLPMSGLQRFFTKVKDLNAGQIAADASKGTVSDLFMTGVAGSLLSKNNYLMTAIGKTREMVPRDMGLNSSMTAPARSMQFVRMGKGDLGKDHSHISMLNANARNTNMAPNVMALAQNTFVGEISKQLDLGEYGKLEAELSKSSNVTGGGGTNAENAAVSKAAVAHFFDDFFVTASAGLNYTGAVEKIGLQHKLYFNYSGLGYNNPGNPYARRGTIQYGLNLKRSWLKNRASVSLRTDIKNMARSAVTGSQWRNYTLALDGRYRVSRKLTLSGRLNESKMNSVSEYGSDAVFLNRKVSFSSQMNAKMWRLPFSSNIMFGLQQLNYESALQPVHSLFINTSISHSVMIGDRMISANLFYNRDVKDAAIYSDLLNFDAGYHYTLLKALQCSSSLTYLDNKDVVRQIGVRQQMGARLLKRWTANVNVDLRKDLLSTPQNYLYGNFRTEMSLHYLIN